MPPPQRKPPERPAPPEPPSTDADAAGPADEVAEREAKVGERERAVEVEEGQLRERRAQLEAGEGELRERQAKLATAEKEVGQREKAVAEREADADSGFQAKKHAHREQLQVHERWLYQKFDADRDALTKQVEDARKQQEQRLAAQEAELDRQRAALTTQRMQAAEAKHEVETERALLEADRKAIGDRVTREARARVDQLELRLGGAERGNKALLDEIRGKDEQLQMWKDLEQRFGSYGVEPGPLLDRLQVLKDENRRLKAEILALPSQETADRLRELEELRQAWVEERARLVRERSELLAEVNSLDAATTEAESLRDHRNTLKATIETYKEQVSSLRQQIDGMLEAVRSAEVFPALSRLGADAKVTGPPPQTDPVPPLPELVAYVRDYLANGDPRLFFTDRDLRCFLGGMAMSRLTLLEGISGIGKTSLPRQFANALGAGEWKIEVQSGWRERQDLLGSYNTFERRYQESEFLRALYLAHCRFFEGRPFFIVLDEMNLSHPEYYFADILSKLEDGKDAEPLELMPTPVENAPGHLHKSSDRGTGIKLPPNVWFFGTANQDETTVSFSDKIYDRAQVIELPSIPRLPEKRAERPEQLHFSVEGLQKAFSDAKKKHSNEAEQVVNAMWGPIGEAIIETLHVGWGARLREQIRDFAPVVIAAGGDSGEAADHVLARRILRKINNRDDLPRTALESLHDKIHALWTKECELGPSGPEAITALLKARIHRSL